MFGLYGFTERYSRAVRSISANFLVPASQGWGLSSLNTLLGFRRRDVRIYQRHKRNEERKRAGDDEQVPRRGTREGGTGDDDRV